MLEDDKEEGWQGNTCECLGQVLTSTPLWPRSRVPLISFIPYLLPILLGVSSFPKYLWLGTGRTAQPWALAGSDVRPFESQGPLVDAQTSII